MGEIHYSHQHIVQQSGHLRIYYSALAHLVVSISFTGYLHCWIRVCEMGRRGIVAVSCECYKPPKTTIAATMGGYISTVSRVYRHILFTPGFFLGNFWKVNYI